MVWWFIPPIKMVIWGMVDPISLTTSCLCGCLSSSFSIRIAFLVVLFSGTPLMDWKVLEVSSLCLSFSLFLSVSLSFSDYLPTYLLIYLSTYLSVCLSIYLPIHLSIYRSIDRSTYLSIYRSIDLSIYLSIYLFCCLSIYLSVCLSVHLSI